MALQRNGEAGVDARVHGGPVRGPIARPCCTPVTPARTSSAELARWARIFRALADPTRLGILALLQAQQGPLCVCDIVAQFPQGQPTISHHLKVLRDAGLVTAERRGPWVYYAPAATGLMEGWRAIGRLMP